MTKLFLMDKIVRILSDKQWIIRQAKSVITKSLVKSNTIAYQQMDTASHFFGLATLKKIGCLMTPTIHIFKEFSTQSGRTLNFYFAPVLNHLQDLFILVTRIYHPKL